MAEAFKKQLGSGVVALVGSAEGKAAVTVAVTADLVDRLSAVDLARAAVAAMRRPGRGRQARISLRAVRPMQPGPRRGLGAIKAALAG